MKLFIGWSGETSKAVAEAIYSWIPSVIQAVRPWMAEADIPKGAQWAGEINRQLKTCDGGVICLTRDNLGEEWINYELGALAMKTFVCPYLFGVEASDLKLPLAQFNAANAEKKDTRRLLETINRALADQSLSQTQLGSAFEKWWPDLNQCLQSVQRRDFLSDMNRSPKLRLATLLQSILKPPQDFKTIDEGLEYFQERLWNVTRNQLQDIYVDVLIQEGHRRTTSSIN